MFNKLRAAITANNEISSESQRFVSLLCLLGAFVISLGTYSKKYLWVFSGEFSFSPTMPSTIFAIAMIAPLYLRGLLKWNRSLYSTVSFVLILGIFASLISLALGGHGFTGHFTGTIVLIALALSWVGIKGIAGISWVIVLIACVYNVMGSITLGIWGFVYLCLAIIGLCFHSGVSPGELIGSLKVEYLPTSDLLRQKVGEDVTAANRICS